MIDPLKESNIAVGFSLACKLDPYPHSFNLFGPPSSTESELRKKQMVMSHTISASEGSADRSSPAIRCLIPLKYC